MKTTVPPPAARAEVEPPASPALVDPMPPAEASPRASDARFGATDDIKFPPMGLARRLAALTGLMSIVLILGATEVALTLSERQRVEDIREESLALANTLAAYLVQVAPTGDRDALLQGLVGWSRPRTSQTHAYVFTYRDGELVRVGSDSLQTAADHGEYEAYSTHRNVVTFIGGSAPGWLVAVPLGTSPTFGVLDVKVSTRRLDDWARYERRKSYMLAVAAALLVALGAAFLTARWVGRPLRELSVAMAGAHRGAEAGPEAPEIGPPEFRLVARRYNQLREALARRERESSARASLLSLEERARNLERLTLLEQTAATFAHEIGTPLNTVSGHLQLLRDDLTASRDTSGVDRVNLLLEQVARVAGIVRAGMERSAWPHLAIRPVDLTLIVDRILRFMEPSFRQANVRADRPAGLRVPVLAACDPALVEQILLNLLKNSIEALSTGGRVTILARSDGAVRIIEVMDDGPGLAPGAIEHLFTPFITTKGPAGTGLGLAVSRRIARALGGDLTHLPSDRGTRWRLTLPAAENV
ncbi:MAG: HAMP domain-containing sensor histidine kinase [Gemmatimonadota bacterium]